MENKWFSLKTKDLKKVLKKTKKRSLLDRPAFANKHALCNKFNNYLLRHSDPPK